MRSPSCLVSALSEPARRKSNRSAMATSLSGPPATDMALPTAPLPREPEPIRARRMVLSSAA